MGMLSNALFLSLTTLRFYLKVNYNYYTGEVGDWKNHFTVADNEAFDAFLDTWSLSKEIPFQY